MSSPVKVLESIIAFLQSKAQKEPVVTGLYALGEGENSATPAKRQKANDAAVALLRKLQENGSTKATDEQKRTLSQYTGTGGNLMDEEGLKGSPYEYYTPVPVAKAMWDLLAEYGVGSASKVLDPSSGTGIFATTAPAGTLMHSIELSDVSGNINRLVNDSPTHSVTVSPFEQVAANTDDETFDTVITNVPFGTNSSRGKNKQLDAKYQGDSLEVYFILRSLDKLKPGGLAMFITPAKIMSSGQFSKFRQQLCRRAELLGAYRLPNKVFSATGADVTTDILVLKKYGREAGKQILDLYSSGNIDLLTEARVMDTDIIKGQYFKHEGKKFLLGEVEEGKGRFGMVERVVNNQSLANILSLVRKFPDSRINWDMLNVANADLPVYQDGDQQVMDGMTFEHQQGQWVQVESAQERVDESLQQNPFAAYVNQITIEDLQAASAQRAAMGKRTEAWKVQLLQQAKTNADCQYWLILASIQDVLEKDATKESYAERFPVLTASMRGIADTYNRSSIKPVNKWARDLAKRVAIAFDKSGDQGISAYWMDGTHAINDIESSYASSAKAAYDRLLYTGAANQFGVAVEDLRKVYPDFDIKNNTEFCLLGDSNKVMLARDYYVGNCQSLLDQIERELAATNDPEVRMKLLDQKQEAIKRIPRQDVRGMSFDLRSTMIPLALKAEFLRQFGHPSVQLSGMDEEDAKLILAGDKPETLDTIIGQLKYGRDSNLDKYLVNRILDALNNNGNLTLRVGKSSGVRQEDHDKVFALLKRKYQDLNLAFDAWLKSDPVYIADLDLQVNSPSLKMFSPELDNSPIVIDGFNPKMQGFKGLNGYQNEEIRRQTRRMEGICGFDVGLGKAQPLNAKILTPNGWVLMGDIKAGDMVISQDGTPTKVTGVYPQGEKEIFEVVFSDGVTTKCCKEHLWLTQTESDRKKERYSRRIGNPRIENGTVKQLTDIKDSLIYQTQKNHKIPMVSPIQFAEKALPVHPYLLGVLLGDGSMAQKAIGFTTVDCPILDKVSSIIASNYGDSIHIRASVKQGKSPQYFFAKSEKMPKNPLTQQLKALGVHGKKSDMKFVPTEYLFASVDQRISLLRGLMDTDGYVSKDGITTHFYSTSVQLADDVIELVQGLGGNARKKFKKTSYKDKNGVKIECLGVYTVSIRMPKAINPFYLPRKANLVKPKSKYEPVRYIVDVVPCGTEQAQCISVEHDSHLYVTDSYIVTHNTLTALASIQNMHNMGVKKRTLIVVPNHTISKWARDAKMAYDSVEDMLVIGSNGNQQEKVDSSFYINDLNSLLKKPYRKVIMTADAFTMIPMRENTLKRYFDKQANDGKKATAISLEDSLSKVIKRLNTSEGRMPYFEELGVDSLVFDEAQLFKNGKTTEGKFARIRGLSLLAEDALSARALSAAVKSDYVRGGNSERDGVMLLTATPFTNSPAEILTMLSLSIGDREALNMLGGASLSSVDDFLSCYANISEIEATTVAGLVTSIDTFTGFKNVAMLKKAIHGVANIQTAKERGLRIPDQDDQTVSVTLNHRDQASLNMLKQAYLQAKEAKENGMADTEILEKVMRLTGESAELLGHPFNLIARMSDVIVMGADMGMTRTIILSYDESQETQVTNLVTKFNAKKFKIKSSRNFPSVEPRDVLKVESKKGDDIRDDGEGGSIYTIQASAKILDNRIIINVDDSGILGRFMGMANDMNVIINPVLSSKVLAMLDNVKAELAMPKTASRSKQLIFCDMLPLHHLIKAALVQQCGIPSSEIAIINAQTMPDGTPGTPSTSEVQFVQDQFKDDAFTIVIANRKAETGIDLQHGTQAIHHLTTGWTPDSITQRNGRGVRQGNQLDRVAVYLYNADGTFDEYKQNLINSKADWIDTLMSKDGYTGGTLNVSRELSKQDYEDLINADSPEAVNKIIQARKEREEQERLARNKAEVTRRIAAYKAAAAVVSKNEDSESLLSKFASDDLATYSGLTSRQRKSKSQDEMNKIQDDIDALLMPWKMISETAASRFSSLAHDNRPGSFYALTGMRANNWLNQKDAANNPIFNRMNMRKQQAINMAEEMRRSFMTFEDSGLSVEDRALSLAGRLVEVNGELYRHGDLIKVNGARYSIALVSNYKVTDFSGYTTGIQKIDPSEHDQAIQELVDSDVNRLNSYRASTVEDAVKGYSSIHIYCLERPELVTLVNEKLGAIRKSEDEREYAFNLSGFQIQDQPYWPDTSESDAIGFINLPENQSLRKQYNATFTDNMLRIEGKQMIFSGATKRKLGINSLYVGSLPSSLLSNITKWCEAREEEFSISLEHAVSVLKLWDEMRRFLRDVKSPSYAAMLSSIGVSQDAITKEDLPKIYRATLDEVIPQVKNRQEIHDYLVKTGAYDDAMVNVVMLAGQSKWTPYVRNGNVAVKSKYGYGHDLNFISVYKEEIKQKAKQIDGGYATFRGSDKAWVYSVPVLEWIAQQKWYDESAIEFLPA